MIHIYPEGKGNDWSFSGSVQVMHSRELLNFSRR